MPGGELDISIQDNYNMILTGAVAKVAEGEISNEIFES
jgi:diaminopimelate epimerase